MNIEVTKSAPKIIALSKSEKYTFHKYNCEQIELHKGLGVEGDIHMGKTVKHRSRVAHDPSQPNLRQVHLIHSELLEELKEKGFTVKPGELGENITTAGINLLGLSKGTVLEIGETAKIEITGLRNPCKQLNTFQSGLMKAVIDKDEEGNLIRKSGIMGIVLEGGVVNVNDEIVMRIPAGNHIPLEKV